MFRRTPISRLSRVSVSMSQLMRRHMLLLLPTRIGPSRIRSLPTFSLTSLGNWLSISIGVEPFIVRVWPETRPFRIILHGWGRPAIISSCIRVIRSAHLQWPRWHTTIRRRRFVLSRWRTGRHSPWLSRSIGGCRRVTLVIALGCIVSL